MDMGLSIDVGSVLDEALGTDLTGKRSAARQAEADRALQREFAQNSIRWRVADAQAAGVHPLAALGAPAWQASPAAIGVPGGSGSTASVSGRTSTPEERALTQLQLKSLEAQNARDFAQASYYSSLAAKANQDTGQGSGGMPSNLSTVRKVPQVQFPGSDTPGVRPGASPMMETFKIDTSSGVRYFDLPAGSGGSPSEALESLSDSPALMAWVIRYNNQKYGRDSVIDSVFNAGRAQVPPDPSERDFFEIARRNAERDKLQRELRRGALGGVR